jgi:DNA-binding NarL/FixJ family response regulator
VDADAPNCPLVSFVGDLRAASPASRIMVLGAPETLDHDVLMALWPRGLAGYLVWEDLRAERPRRSHWVPSNEAGAVSNPCMIAYHGRATPSGEVGWFPPEVVQLGPQDSLRSPGAARAARPLTAREHEVLQLIGAGVLYKRIAVRLPRQMTSGMP